MLEAEAKKRQVAAGGDKKSEAAKSVNQKIDEPKQTTKQPQSLDQAAEKFSTNRQYVADAKKLKGENSG